ncbi:hypothetical protein IEO21_08890 [Rhodonia placenta]|uniref:DUF7928 domain-containing protein n=1 Tax=Rhodonia placenta TaxID=104341 RepID=A0A8H7NVL4_9APHY|nr:hypothetical protein IEO21_08890 [Postia placenta]
MDATTIYFTTLEQLEIAIQGISGDERYTSVCLHTDQLVLTSDSTDLPFAAATSRLGCEVAVKARTKGVEDTLRIFDVQDAVEVAGSHIPIVSSIEALDDAGLYLYDAALVRDEKVLVVWCDKATAIVEQYRRTEHCLRHFVSDCTCDSGRHSFDLDASVKEQVDDRYAGYDGYFDETVRKRLLDSANRMHAGFLEQGETSAPTQATASASGDAGASHAIQDKEAHIYSVVSPCPRTMSKAETSGKYDNASRDMVVSDSSADNDNEDVDSLVGRETDGLNAVSVSEAYATRRYGRTSQSRGGKHAPPTNSTRVGSQEPLPRITAAQKEKWRATDSSIKDENAGPSTVAPEVTHRSQPSRNAKRKRPCTDNNDRVDGFSDSRNKKQKTTRAAPPQQQKEFVCPREKCEHKGFNRKSDFHRHLLGCFDIRQLVCSRCGTTWARKDARNRHVKETSCDRSQGPTGNGGGTSTQIGDGGGAATQLGVSIEDLAYVLSFLTEFEMALLFRGNEDDDEGAD